MTDIIERLRARATRLDWATVPTHELEQAADEIERLREALRWYSEIGQQHPEYAAERMRLDAGAMARAVLSQKEGE